MSDEDGCWRTREEAKEILGLTEEEFAAQLKEGKISSHRSGKWAIGGRVTRYFIGENDDE